MGKLIISPWRMRPDVANDSSRNFSNSTTQRIDEISHDYTIRYTAVRSGEVVRGGVYVRLPSNEEAIIAALREQEYMSKYLSRVMIMGIHDDTLGEDVEISAIVDSQRKPFQVLT